MGHEVLPQRPFLLVDSYCVERGCDCRSVLLGVHDVERGRQVATVNYSFEPPTGHDADFGQIFLDPINPQSGMSEPLLEVVADILENDRDYRDRLLRHYRMMKDVIEDPSHPEYERARGWCSSVGQDPVRRAGPKVGANDPCPCGSGKKFKRCCR